MGTRPIDIHIRALKKLSVEVKEEQGFIVCDATNIKGANINLDFPSVGATENIILASCLTNGTTIINNAAMEPEIVDLVRYLNKMGAKINGEGTNKIVINGVKKLKTANYNVMPDRIEAGTFLCAAASTGGEVTVVNVCPQHLEAVINKMEECGCTVKVNQKSIHLKAPKKIKPVEIKTTVYPGFPTDMQQIFSAMLLKASGTSVVLENIFENRYKYISELMKMNCKIIQDGRAAIITGKRKIQAAEVSCTDLRGGVALVIAALTAKGTSRIRAIDYIYRGYENFEEKLQKIGAKIKLIDD